MAIVLWIVSDLALRRTPIALLYFRWCDHKAVVAHSSCWSADKDAQAIGSRHEEHTSAKETLHYNHQAAANRI